MLGSHDRKLGHGHTLGGDKSGPSCFLCLCTSGCRGEQPLSVTAHCLTTGPRPRVLGLKAVKSEATSNGVSFRPISSLVPSQKQKSPTNTLQCVCLLSTAPWEATWGLTASPAEQLSSIQLLSVAADSGIAILAQEG